MLANIGCIFFLIAWAVGLLTQPELASAFERIGLAFLALYLAYIGNNLGD